MRWTSPASSNSHFNRRWRTVCAERASGKHEQILAERSHVAIHPRSRRKERHIGSMTPVCNSKTESGSLCLV